MTGRSIVSDVRSLHKLLSSDSLLTDRAILSEIKTSTFLLVRRETNLRRLWSTSTIFTTIPCLQMQTVPISECCDYQDPCNISRTKIKLPRISEGNYQYLIQGVYSINAMGGKGKKFKEISINRYLNLLKLPLIKKEAYYWILNDYLYCTDPDLETIRIAAFFEEDVPNEIMYPKEGCGDCQPTNEQLCLNPLDKSFPLPGYLEEQVKTIVSQKLLNTFFKLRIDQTSDGVDGQSPNAKPTS